MDSWLAVALIVAILRPDIGVLVKALAERIRPRRQPGMRPDQGEK